LDQTHNHLQHATLLTERSEFCRDNKTAAETLQTPYYVPTNQSAAENGIYQKNKIKYKSRLYFSEIIAWGQSVAVLSQRGATRDLD